MFLERWVSSVVVLGGLAAAAFLFRAPASAADGVSDAAAPDRIVKGLAISPVPLDLRGKDRALVGLGSYLVNAQNACNDCHTEPPYEPGHDPFQSGHGRVNAGGYLKGGRLMGNILVPDLTPDARGLPGGLTLEQFAHVMRTGDDLAHPGRILQIMPWPVYCNMLEGDLRAIYEYLKTIPSR